MSSDDKHSSQDNSLKPALTLIDCVPEQESTPDFTIEVQLEDAVTDALPVDESLATTPAQPSNVINLFTGQQASSQSLGAKIVRIVPETCGVRMLYTNYDQPDRLIAVPLLCWAMDETGEIFGIVPWLDEILPCECVAEKYSIDWEGYYCPASDGVFYEPAESVVAQLSIAARYDTGFSHCVETPDGIVRNVVQEIADPVGTHALLLNPDSDSLLLTSVISWVLDENGQMHGMLADDNAVEKLPVLPGDNCLFSAHQAENFRCFFQRDIAEQIRTQHPETLEAIEQLFAQ